MSFAAINQTGTVDIVPAQAGKVVVLESYQLTASGAVTVKFQSKPTGGAATDLTGPMIIGAGGNLRMDSVQMGLCQTNTGEGLTLFCSAGVLAGHIRYSYR